MVRQYDWKRVNLKISVFATIVDQMKYQIEFQISRLQFKHHPLFSAEHVLASDLIGQYQQYKLVDRHKIADHLREKVHMHLRIIYM